MCCLKCYRECSYYEDEYSWEEERSPGCNETMTEPPTCKYGDEPYRDTWDGADCLHGLGK